MIKKVWKVFLAISICFILSCNEINSYNTYYLDSKDCNYLLKSTGDTLILDYHLNFDTTTFELSSVDSSKFSLFQSAYFAWHVNYISYRILRLNKGYDYITVNWKSDTSLFNSLFSITNCKTELDKEFRDTLHYSFISYMIDSISVEDYFIYNNILNKLYILYKDPRLAWNYAYLVNQYEKNQCGNSQKNVSFEVFVLLNIGIDNSNLNTQKKEELIKHNHFFTHKCFPNKLLMNKKFDFLNLKI